MTTTLTLYSLKHLKENKNFVIDDVSGSFNSFLTADKYESLTINDFQFQRFELEKKIKINSSQINSINIKGSQRWNYVSISASYTATTYPPEVRTKVYYYFITKITQISQACIELELKMDVLNTFNFVNTRTTDEKESQYTLSDRSLITRQHKDRFLISTEYIGRVNDFAILYTMWMNKYLVISDNFIKSVDNTTEGFYFDSADYPDFKLTTYKIKIYDSNGDLLYETSDDLLESHFLRITHTTIPNKTTITTDRLVSIGGTTQFVSYTHECFDYPSLVLIEFVNIEEITQTIIDNFNDFINKTSLGVITKSYGRKIDKFPEGIDTILFKNDDNDKYLIDSDGLNTWYISYGSENAVVSSEDSTEAKYVNPVQIVLYSDNGYSVGIHGDTTRRIRPSDLGTHRDVGEALVFDVQNFPAGAYIEIAGTRYANTYVHRYVAVLRENDTDSTFIHMGWSDSPIETGIAIDYSVLPFEYVDCYGFDTAELYLYVHSSLPTRVYKYYGEFSVNAGESDTPYTSDPIRDVDLTDPKLIKIINIPYAPRDDLINISYIPSDMVWNATKGGFEVNNPQYANFDRKINFTKNPLNVVTINFEDVSMRMSRNIQYESKLFNSDYWLDKFVYDSFSFGFRLESLDVENYISTYGENAVFKVRFVVSPNVNSKFMFQFPQYVCNLGMEDFSNVLIVERNNEIALYSNAYINYIRSGGFRNDSKNIDQQKLTNGIITALTTIGAIGSFASSVYTGGVGVAAGISLATATASRTISAIQSGQQADRGLAQKLSNLSQQSSSVSTCEDISILKSYCNNKAKLCHYEVTEYTKNALWDLFHYYGYKCHDYEIPNVNSRCNFNYVQGEILLDEYSFDQSIADEIVKKWREGITFIHANLIGGVMSYDIEQKYENVENSLLDWLEE